MPRQPTSASVSRAAIILSTSAFIALVLSLSLTSLYVFAQRSAASSPLQKTPILPPFLPSSAAVSSTSFAQFAVWSSLTASPTMSSPSFSMRGL